MVYLIDLPKLGSDAQYQDTFFSAELKRFLLASGLDGGLVQSLNKYDFSKTASQAFVHTMYGPDDLELRLLAQLNNPC
jgi:hypothetical protein